MEPEGKGGRIVPTFPHRSRSISQHRLRTHVPFGIGWKGDEPSKRPGWLPDPTPLGTGRRSEERTGRRKEGAPFHRPTDVRVPSAMALANDEAAKAGSNRIQVSNTKKPLFFYVNLSKVRASRSERKRNVDPVENETPRVDRTDPMTAWSGATTCCSRAQDCRHREERCVESMCMQEDRIDGGSNDRRWTWRTVLTWPCGYAESLVNPGCTDRVLDRIARRERRLFLFPSIRR